MRKYKKVTKTCYRCKGKPSEHYATYGSTCWTCKGKGTSTSKQQIMRCCGGPHSGKHLTQDEAGEGYLRYNPCVNRGKDPYPCVLMHEELLDA